MECHPSALELVAMTVHEFLAGDLEAFLSTTLPIFDYLRTILDQQFVRLSALEKAVLLGSRLPSSPCRFRPCAIRCTSRHCSPRCWKPCVPYSADRYLQPVLRAYTCLTWWQPISPSIYMKRCIRMGHVK